MTQKRSNLDIQFGNAYEPEKMRRLAEEIRSLNSAMNSLVGEFDEFSGGDSDAFIHELASTSGLGSLHTVSGLTEGMVLIATEAEDAAFRFLELNDLDDVDVDGATSGSVLMFVSGRWVPANIPDFEALGDPGQDSVVVWDESANAMAYASLGSTLVLAGGILSVVTSGLDHGALSGLNDDDHSAVYPAYAQNETITGEWTFDAFTFFEDDIFHSDIAIRHVWQETDADTDEMIWELFIDSGVFGWGTRTDLDASGTLFFQLFREGTDITQFLMMLRDFVHESDAPLRVVVDTDAFADQGRWHETVETGLWAHGTRTDDETGGDDWVQVNAYDGVIEQINFQGDLLTFNGSELVTVDSSPNWTGVHAFLDSIIIEGALVTPPRLISASDAVGDLDQTIIVDATGGNVIAALPPVAEKEGRRLEFKRIDGSVNTVTIEADGTETIDGAANQPLAAQYDSLKLVAGPTEWHIV